MSVAPLPRPRTLDEAYNLIVLLAQRLDTLAARVEIIVGGQLDLSGQIGRIVAAVSNVESAIANLRAELVPIRERTASAHDLERVAHRIERSAEDILDSAEEITSPGVARRFDSEPVRKTFLQLEAERALRAQQDREASIRKIATTVIATILISVLGFIAAKLVR